MKKIKHLTMALSMLLMVMLISSVAASCGGEDDEPQPVPEPEPEAIAPLVIKTTTLCGYDWNGYNENSNLCMMEIKSTDSNPQISANSSESWVTTYVAKGADGTDADGYYTFYIMANIDKNDSETARDFKIKVSAKANYNGSTISESESCSCTQYGYITIDEFRAINENVAKWQLRSEVAQIKLSDSPEINYIKNDYYDPSKFLYRSPITVETSTGGIIGAVDPNTGKPISTTVTETIVSDSYFSGENLGDTFLSDKNYFYFSSTCQEIITEDSKETIYEHFQIGIISISETELILQYNNADGIYSFYLTALE